MTTTDARYWAYAVRHNAADVAAFQWHPDAVAEARRMKASGADRVGVTTKRLTLDELRAAFAARGIEVKAVRAAA